MLTALGCSTPVYERRFEPIFPTTPRLIHEKSTKQLYINKNSSYHYIIKKSSEEGEQDLIDLVKDAELEEAWLFDKINQRWIEIGKRETDRRVEDDNLLTRTLGSPKDYIHYHLHPKQEVTRQKLNELEKLETEMLSRLEEKQDKKTKDNLREALMIVSEQKIYFTADKLRAAFPSSLDTVLGSLIESAVASEYGIMHYKFITPKNYPEIQDFIGLLYEYNLHATILNELRNNYFNEWLDPNPHYTPEKAIQSVVDHINKKLKGKVSLKFKPITPRKTLPSPSVPPVTSSRKRA